MKSIIFFSFQNIDHQNPEFEISRTNQTIIPLQFSWRYGTSSCVATQPSMLCPVPSPEISQKTTPFFPDSKQSWKHTKNKSKPKIPEWKKHANLGNNALIKPKQNLLWDLRKGSQRVKIGEMNTNWDENWKRHQKVQLKFYFSIL